MSLPNGYKRVEYIQSSGTQYIDTGYIPNNNTRIATKFLWGNTTSSYLFGAVDSSNAKSFTATVNSTGGNWRFDGTLYKYTAKSNTLYTAVMDSSGVNINGTLYKYTGTPSSFTALGSLTICAGKDAAGVIASYFSGKIYYFKIYDDGTLVRDYIPCINGNEVAGLYDTVNGVFYPSVSGSFVAGRITALPSDYTKIQYIESSGTQYIDIGFKPNNDTRVVLDMQCTNVVAASHTYFGGRTGVNDDGYCFWGYAVGGPRSDYGSSPHQSFATAESANRVIIDKNKNVTSYGAETVTHSANTFQSSYNLYLFCLNNAGSAVNFSSMMVFSCQVYDNGILIRDLIPCINANGEVGLHDEVNGVFYENKGSGAFVSGPGESDEYKIVNATALDRAITATANAIRAKTGATDKLPWNESVGFASAVRAISSGSKIVSGTFTVTTVTYLSASPLKISGIGFKPTRVIIYLAVGDTMHEVGHLTFTHGEFGARNYSCATNRQVSPPVYSTGGAVCTMNNDGFTLSSEQSLLSLHQAAYNYVAIG